MPKLLEPPPRSPIEPVTEVLHGVTVTDPYRWLEDQDSAQTRVWLEAQTKYARAYLESIPGRGQIRERIRELLDVETYDSIQRVGARYFFRKRLPGQEQFCIYFREGPDKEDCLLIDPAERGTGKHTAVKPLRVSSDGRLLLYEVKEGGERTGTFELLDIQKRKTLPDVLPRGYLRGFAFAPDSRGFYYVHEPLCRAGSLPRAAYHHVLGAESSDDEKIFSVESGEKSRLCLISDSTRIGLLVYRFLEKTRTDFYLKNLEDRSSPQAIITDADYALIPLLIPGKILAITDRDAPNFRIVELCVSDHHVSRWIERVPECDSRITQWLVVGNRLFVSYVRQTKTEVLTFDFAGNKVGEVPIRTDETVRFVGDNSCKSNELIFEAESFTEPISVFKFSADTGRRELLAKRTVPFCFEDYAYTEVSYTSKDGTRVPMFLVGAKDVLAGRRGPTIMTSYGGYGVSITPQFSVFVAFLVERGCLFALPRIRGGAEFGVGWHIAAKGRNRQAAYDDFLCAAEWLIQTGRTVPEKLAIFGGSNSGLLVAAAMTQRPDLFRAVVCMAPLLDMLRYHLFDNAYVWREEFGIADDPDDFAALASYSPYHQVRNGVGYPATMIVSGDADGNCNPLHARKMTARLQTASSSGFPILLDYNRFRGHSPVLPLSDRIEALTDRMAFLCEHLHLLAGQGRR